MALPPEPRYRTGSEREASHDGLRPDRRVDRGGRRGDRLGLSISRGAVLRARPDRMVPRRGACERPGRSVSRRRVPAAVALNRRTSRREAPRRHEREHDHQRREPAGHATRRRNRPKAMQFPSCEDAPTDSTPEVPVSHVGRARRRGLGPRRDEYRSASGEKPHPRTRAPQRGAIHPIRTSPTSRDPAFRWGGCVSSVHAGELECFAVEVVAAGEDVGRVEALRGRRRGSP